MSSVSQRPCKCNLYSIDDAYRGEAKEMAESSSSKHTDNCESLQAKEPASMDCRSALRQFIASTSLKGAPRIVKSSSIYSSVYWLVIVLVLLTLTALMAIVLTRDFLEFKSVITLKEYNTLNAEDRSRLRETYGYKFPAVTVCNNNRFQSDYAEALPPEVLTQSEFLAETARKHEELNVTHALWRELAAYSYGIYLLPYIVRRGLAPALRQHYEDFLVSCVFSVEYSVQSEEHSCERLAQITHLMQPNSATCYRIDVTDETFIDQNHITGLSFVLYLDNFSQFIPINHFDVFHDEGVQTGALVVTHLSGTTPQLFDTSSKLAPGKNTQIMLQTTAFQRLPAPHGDCVRSGEHRLYGYNGDRQPYSQRGCIIACQQAHIMNTCRCLYSPKMLFLDPNTRISDAPQCHKFYSNVSLSYENLNCAQAATKEAEHECVRKCKPDCTEIQFSLSATSSDWPAKTTQLAFYNTFIANHSSPTNLSRQEKFAPDFEPIQKAVQAGNITQALTLLRKTRIIDDNFLKASIILDSTNILAFESQPSVSPLQFLSYIGGTMNLYAGITIVVVFEVIEFIVKMVCRRCDVFPGKL